MPQYFMDFPGGTVIKNPPANARDLGDTGLIPGSEVPPVERSILAGNPTDSGAWWSMGSQVSDMTDSN